MAKKPPAFKPFQPKGSPKGMPMMPTSPVKKPAVKTTKKGK